MLRVLQRRTDARADLSPVGDTDLSPPPLPLLLFQRDSFRLLWMQEEFSSDGVKVRKSSAGFSFYYDSYYIVSFLCYLQSADQSTEILPIKQISFLSEGRNYPHSGGTSGACYKQREAAARIRAAASLCFGIYFRVKTDVLHIKNFCAAALLLLSFRRFYALRQI